MKKTSLLGFGLATALALGAAAPAFADNGWGSGYGAAITGAAIQNSQNPYADLRQPDANAQQRYYYYPQTRRHSRHHDANARYYNYNNGYSNNGYYYPNGYYQNNDNGNAIGAVLGGVLGYR